MTRVLIVDDQALVRAGLRALLENTADIEVVGEASHGGEALGMGRRLRPDVFLIDLKMPVLDGIETTRAIRADPLLAETAVLILTTFDDDQDVVEAIRGGATGYLLKDTDPEDLRRAIRAAVRGDPALAPAVARRLMEKVANAAPDRSPDPRLGKLTERELEVLVQVGRGLSNEEVGRALFISPETARTYVSRLLGKLGARDRAQLVVLAHRAGLVD